MLRLRLMRVPIRRLKQPIRIHAQLRPPLAVQAEYFSWAVFGHGLNDTLLGRARTSADIGGQKAKLSEAVQDYFTEVCCMRKTFADAQSPPGTLETPA